MLTIRRMTKEDAAQAAALEKENFYEPWTEKAFLDALCLDYAYYYVAETEEAVAEGRHIIGVCGLRDIAGEGEITNVSVSRSCRRQGIAAAMLERALKDGADLGIEAFTLEVRCSNFPAIRLYEKFGFAGEGVRKGFYRNPPAAFEGMTAGGGRSLDHSGEGREDALIMWKR